MNSKMLAMVLCMALAPAMSAQKKEAQRLDRTAKALQVIVSIDKGLHHHIMDQAYCVMIYPSVKKVAFGVGDSYGRGALVCRKGTDMKGEWGGPVMYAMDQASLGVQFGTTATDFVLVVVSKKGVDGVLNGKVKLGTDASATAGPTGTEASTYSVTAAKADILTYSHAKGLFVGVSLAGALMEVDVDSNTALYGKEMTPAEIVKGDQETPAAAVPLVDLLDTVSYARAVSVAGEKTSSPK